MHKSLAIFATVIFLWAIPCPAHADPWVERLLEKREHDFGTVARGSDVSYRFPVKNKYRYEIELVSVRSSCECTQPEIETKALQPGETGHVVATFNTRTYTGQHSATITLLAAWNDNGIRRIGESQLRVYGSIRGDVVIEPGSVEFGDVRQGTSAEQKVLITFEGKKDWRITDVRSTSENLETDLSEVARTDSNAVHELLVRLTKSASAGCINELLLLITKDAEIPLLVSGRVISKLSVTPESLFLGNVALGKQVTKRVVVRAIEPFRVRSVTCESNCFQFKTDNDLGTRHIVEITFEAKGDVGERNETMQIATDLGGEYTAHFWAHVIVESETNVIPRR